MGPWKQENYGYICCNKGCAKVPKKLQINTSSNGWEGTFFANGNRWFQGRDIASPNANKRLKIVRMEKEGMFFFPVSEAGTHVFHMNTNVEKHREQWTLQMRKRHRQKKCVGDGGNYKTNWAKFVPSFRIFLQIRASATFTG